jgi:hypothetical protein
MIMRPKLIFSLVVLASLVSYGLAQERVEHARLLDLPLFPTSLVRTNIPLSKALSEIGVKVRGGYVLFGIELLLRDGKEPNVNLNLEPGSTLGTALKQVFDQLPDCRFEVVSDHLVNVFPVGAKRDPKDPLNLRLTRFDAVAAHPDHIIAKPDDLIPELRALLTPKRPMTSEGYGYADKPLISMGPTATFHLRNVTVRDILNAASEATEQYPAKRSPLGWVYSFSPDSKSPLGGIHSWGVHWSVPANWKEEAAKGRTPSR